MDSSLNLYNRLPTNVEELSVLNLGAGYCASTISGQIPDMKFKNLVNVEIWPASFIKLRSLNFKAASCENHMCEIGVFIGRDFDENFFDVILLIDVIEHFRMEDALVILNRCRYISKRVVLFLPIGPCAQDDLDGNPYQTHLSTWALDDFREASVEYYPKFHTHFNPPVDAAWVIYEK